MIIRKRLGRLFSLVLTPLAATLSFSTAMTVAVQPTMAQSAAASCFTGVDYLSLSYGELSSLVSTAVAQMGPGLSGDQIAISIGAQLGASANNCSAAQLQALANNVARILTGLGITTTTNVAVLVGAGLDPTTASTSEPNLVDNTPYGA